MARKAERPDPDKDILEQNFSLFKDCLASRIVTSLSASDQGDSEDLDEFCLYLAQEAWLSLPLCTRGLTYSVNPLPEADEIELDIPPSFADSLAAYGILSTTNDLEAPYSFLRHVITSYIPLATTPPPTWSSTRTSECEICQRAVPLTYHHLIPRSTHVRAVKRGWHPPDMLGSVAWLCRPCHSIVHSVFSNEELAKELYNGKADGVS